MGTIGCFHNERLIPVDHAAPYGTVNQSIKLVSSSDNSVYEGTEPRYRRTDWVFNLRTWLLKQPVTAWGDQAP
jgi:hypothetical protein